jgi:hypothetical protein
MTLMPPSDGDAMQRKGRGEEANGGMGGRLRHFVQEAKRRHLGDTAKRALD